MCEMVCKTQMTTPLNQGSLFDATAADPQMFR